jgi:hypothetical protein
VDDETHVLVPSREILRRESAGSALQSLHMVCDLPTRTGSDSGCSGNAASKADMCVWMLCTVMSSNTNAVNIALRAPIYGLQVSGESVVQMLPRRLRVNVSSKDHSLRLTAGPSCRSAVL